MGLKRTLVLFLVILGLVAVLYATGGEEKEPSGLGKPVLENRALLSAKKISIKPSPDHQRLDIFRADDGYFYVDEPVRDQASLAKLSGIAGIYNTALIYLAYEGEQLSDKVWEETGLAPPRGYLEAEFAGDVKIRIDLGLPGPMGDDFFVAKGGKIYRGQRSLESSLQGNPDDYRERLVVRNTAGQVAQVRIERASDTGRESILLRRRGDHWELVEPEKMRLDQTVAQSLLAMVLSLRADSFVEGRQNDGQGPPQEPDVVVEISGQAGDERLEFMVQQQAAMIGRSVNRGILFTCDSGTYSRVFNMPIQQMRAHWLLPFSIDQLGWIKIDHGIEGGAVLHLERQANSGFKMIQPIKSETNATPVAELLQGLRELFVQSFVEDGAEDLARYGLDHGYLTVQLHDSRLGQTTTLHIGADENPELTYLRRADEPHVITVPKIIADRLREEWVNYLDLSVLDLGDHQSIGRVECRRGSKMAVYLREGGGWQREGDPAAASLDDFAELFDDVMRDLRGEEALDLLSAGELPTALELRLMRAGGSVLHSLQLYEMDAGRVLARRAAEPALIELSRRDARDLIGLWPR